jgi:hypothetical protein
MKCHLFMTASSPQLLYLPQLSWIVLRMMLDNAQSGPALDA